MKQIQKPTNKRLTPFRKLAVAACLVTTLGCGAANETVIPDYWGARHTEVSHSKARLTNLFREKTVEVAGAKVSFVIPNDSLSDLAKATERHEQTDASDETAYMIDLRIKNVPFGFSNGKNQWSTLLFTYAIEKGEHNLAAAFSKELDQNPQFEEYIGVRNVVIPQFPKLLRKLGGEFKGIRFVAETVGIPTTVFGIPMDSKNRPIGSGPWGQLAIGASFNPSKRELVARPVVIVPEGKTREEARDALAQKLGSP